MTAAHMTGSGSLGAVSELMDTLATRRAPVTAGRAVLATLAIGDAASGSGEQRRSIRCVEIAGGAT